MWLAVKALDDAERETWIFGCHDCRGASALISASQMTGSSRPFLVGCKKIVRFFTNGRRWPSCLCFAVTCFSNLWKGSSQSALTDNLASPPAPKMTLKMTFGEASVKTKARSGAAGRGAAGSSGATTAGWSGRAGGLQARQPTTSGAWWGKFKAVRRAAEKGKDSSCTAWGIPRTMISRGSSSERWFNEARFVALFDYVDAGGEFIDASDEIA